ATQVAFPDLGRLAFHRNGPLDVETLRLLRIPEHDDVAASDLRILRRPQHDQYEVAGLDGRLHRACRNPEDPGVHPVATEGAREHQGQNCAETRRSTPSDLVPGDQRHGDVRGEMLAEVMKSR